MSGERLLTVANPPNREVLQFNGISEIHFFLNPGSVRVDRRYAEVERFGDLTLRDFAHCLGIPSQEFSPVGSLSRFGIEKKWNSCWSEDIILSLSLIFDANFSAK